MITIESTEKMGSKGQGTETKLSIGLSDNKKLFMPNELTACVRSSGSSHPLSNSKLQEYKQSELNSQQQLTFIVEGLLD